MKPEVKWSVNGDKAEYSIDGVKTYFVRDGNQWRSVKRDIDFLVTIGKYEDSFSIQEVMSRYSNDVNVYYNRGDYYAKEINKD